MCGWIAAIGNLPSAEHKARAACMRMRTRGPDDDGLWQSEAVCLGHRRLAIQDLDHRAAQPMHSTDGRYVIVFNGEIYNFRHLREQLQAEGVRFVTESDTEVLLALFAREGEAMLPRLRGMFSFLIWDRHARRAFVARDAYGIKPLYYARTADGLLLGSQVQALLATGAVGREPDPRGQATFWLLGSVAEPSTWYRDIRALPAGHCAWVTENGELSMHAWRDIGATWRAADALPQRPADEVQDHVRQALLASVRDHLVADVPVGVFLSGGIDSGALAGLMVEAGAHDLVGVTVAFDEFAGSERDEAPDAARLAAHYGLRHHVRRVTRDEFHADLPPILEAMDQPSIDGVNTWYASKAVAELGLKVVVSGVGGDELFQGYSSFVQLPRLVGRWQAATRIPGMQALGRAAGAWQARRSGNARWGHAAEWARSMAGAWWLRRGLFAPEDLPGLMGAELATAAMAEFSAEDWVQKMTGPLPTDPRLALGQIESMTYLRNQLLRDSDWASMDHSVELRTPLVDGQLLHTLGDWLPSFARLPGKALLANAVAPPLPEAISKRRKTGFGIPLARWAGHAGEDNYRGWARQLALHFAGDGA